MDRIWEFLNWYPSLGIRLILGSAIIVFGLVFLRYLVLGMVGLRTKDPKRRTRWRHFTFYLALIAGFILISQGWIHHLDEIVESFGPVGPKSQEHLTRLLSGSYYAFLLGIILLILLQILKNIFNFLKERMGQWKFTSHPMRVQGVDIIAPDQFKKIIAGLLKLLYVVSCFILLYFYIPLILRIFPKTEHVGDELWFYITKPAKEIAWGILNYLPNVVYLVLIVLVVRYFIKLARFFLKGIENGQIKITGFEREWADPTFKLFRAAAFIFTLVIIYPFLPGAGSEIFKGFSIFVGALVTFGSSAAVGNILSGVLLTYSGSFRMGDFIEVGQTKGYVVKRGLMVTKLRTLKNEEVNLPNKIVLDGEVVNYSALAKTQGLAISIKAGIGYDAPWHQVLELLLEAAKKTKGVIEDPPPFVRQDEVDNFSGGYELRAYIDQADQMQAISSELRKNILDTFHDAGVEIMTPMAQTLRNVPEAAIPKKNS
ncbi:MAG: mechanosensitive ion channel [bacterium]|nr:mechanosensitive ion channel [bacterium]